MSSRAVVVVEEEVEKIFCTPLSFFFFFLKASLNFLLLDFKDKALLLRVFADDSFSLVVGEELVSKFWSRGVEIFGLKDEDNNGRQLENARPRLFKAAEATRLTRSEGLSNETC